MNQKVIRLITLGDSQVGKSSLLLRFTSNDFSEDYMTTIGIDFRMRKININNIEVKIQIWDTAGQERFRTITRNYYKGAHGIILVYDVNSESSYNNIRKWINDVKLYSENCKMILIANKVDLINNETNLVNGIELAKELNMNFFKTSAKTGENVDNSIIYLVKEIINDKENIYKKMKILWI
jgi:small GTP-binding protein